MQAQGVPAGAKRAAATGTANLLRGLAGVDGDDDYMSISAFDAPAAAPSSSSSSPNAAGLNLFGSNTITWDEIMGMMGTNPSSSSSTGNNRGNAAVTYDAGWESDVSSVGNQGPTRAARKKAPAPSSTAVGGLGSGNNAGLGQETEAEREEREERERVEFIEAIRAARAAEEAKLNALDGGPTVGSGSSSSSSSSSAAGRAGAGAGAGEAGTAKGAKKGTEEEEYGRVFADDGDILDESLVEEKKKKTALELLEEAKKGKELKPGA